jgi:hypothetical protein
VNGPLVPNTAVAKALAGGDAKTATEKAPAAASNKPSGRKLMQGNSGGGSRSRGAANAQWAAQNTQDAIRAAASGRRPVSYATAAGTRSTHAVSSNCINCLTWDQARLA